MLTSQVEKYVPSAATIYLPKAFSLGSFQMSSSVCVLKFCPQWSITEAWRHSRVGFSPWGPFLYLRLVSFGKDLKKRSQGQVNALV